MAECSTSENEINTLEKSLKEFDIHPILVQLDTSLNLVRRNKMTEKEHLDVLKTVDKNLLKLSLTHHPDKVISKKTPKQEQVRAQDRQVALNATRKVLEALTKVFLKDIDIHYSYEFFAKMNINSLINEKEMDRRIDNMLCKISLMSEIKRVNIIGEIRKFLLESRESLHSFLIDNKDEFERHRDNAFYYLHKCIEGYKVLVTECEFIVKDCRGEQDESARSAMEKTYDQSRIEMNILKYLKKKAEKSLQGKLQIFCAGEAVSKYDYYLVSPFVCYINVMLMCTSVMNRNSGWWKFFKTFVKEKNSCLPNRNNAKDITSHMSNHDNYIKSHASNHNNYKKDHVSNDYDHPPQFITAPVLFLNAYHLASYICNNAQHEREVETMFRRNNLDITTDNIINAFKDAVIRIEEFLYEEFYIDSYKEGKSNREKFTEKLSQLNESISRNREAEKEIQEKINLCKKETYEIRKEYFEFAAKIQETEIQCRENILKCQDTSEEIARLKLGCRRKKDTQSRFVYGNEINETTSSNKSKDEITEAELMKKLEEYKEIGELLLNFLIDCRQNCSKLTGGQSSCSNQNGHSPVVLEKIEKKIKANYELNEKINAELCYIMTQTSSELTEEISNQDSDSKDNLKKSNNTNTADVTGESQCTDVALIDFTSLEQNATQNINMITIDDASSCEQNIYPLRTEDIGKLLKKTEN